MSQNEEQENNSFSEENNYGPFTSTQQSNIDNNKLNGNVNDFEENNEFVYVSWCQHSTEQINLNFSQSTSGNSEYTNHYNISTFNTNPPNSQEPYFFSQSETNESDYNNYLLNNSNSFTQNDSDDAFDQSGYSNESQNSY